MSLARRIRDRQAGVPVARASHPAPEAEASPAAKDPFIAEMVAKRPPAFGVARKLRERFEARVSQAALLAAAAAKAANDNDADAAASTPYDLQRIQLGDHKRQLSAMQSVEKRIALKRTLLPLYDPWVDAVLAAAGETGRAAEDEVVATMLVWSVDCADWDRALKIAEHQLRFGLGLPPKFKRDLPTFLAEQVSEAALKAYAARQDFDATVVELFAELVDGRDMPDEVKAQLVKAQAAGRVRFLETAEAAERQVAGGRAAALKDALDLYRRALELDARSGVKTEIQRLEKELKKETAPPPAS